MTTDVVSPFCLSTAQAAQFLGVTESTLRKWRSNRVGPAYLKSAKKGSRVFYLRDDLEAWALSRRVLPADSGVA